MAPPNERRMQTVPERRHVGRLEHPSAVRRCASGRRGQRTKTTARRASWSVSPGYYALTQVPFPRAPFILSRGCFVSGPPRRFRDRNGITTDSATAALGFRSRDRDRTGSVAVEALRRFIHRLRPKRAAYVLRGAVPGSRGERAQAVVPKPSTRSPRTSGVHQGRAGRPPPEHPPDHPRGCDDSLASRVRDPSRSARRLLPGHPRTSPAGATARSPRAPGIHRGRAHRPPPGRPPDHPRGPDELVHLAHPVFIEDVLTGCLRDILRPSTGLRRLGHFARPVCLEDVVHRSPPGNPRTIHAAATTRTPRASGVRSEE